MLLASVLAVTLARAEDALLPDHPSLLYDVACAYARNGRNQDAIETLDRLAAMGLFFPVAEDADFAAIRDAMSFRRTIERFQGISRPCTGRSPRSRSIARG